MKRNKIYEPETIYDIAKWHQETFPDATLDGQIDKYDEEQKEFIDSKYKDVTELADMFIVACGMTRFDAFTAIWYLKDVYDWVEECSILERDVEQAVAKKMAINRHRVWEKKGGLYKHIKDD